MGKQSFLYAQRKIACNTLILNMLHEISTLGLFRLGNDGEI